MNLGAIQHEEGEGASGDGDDKETAAATLAELKISADTHEIEEPL